MKNLIENARTAHKTAEALSYKQSMDAHHATCQKLARKLGVWMNTHLQVDFNTCTFFLPCQPSGAKPVVYAAHEGLLFAVDDQPAIAVVTLTSGNLAVELVHINPKAGVTFLESLGKVIEGKVLPTVPQDVVSASGLFDEYDLDVLQELLGWDLYTGHMRLGLSHGGQTQ